MNNRGLLAMKAVKLVLKFGFVTLDVIVSFASDKQSAPRYTPMQAKMLYDEGRISNAEYSQAFYHND